jgi:hypothetical protein
MPVIIQSVKKNTGCWFQPLLTKVKLNHYDYTYYKRLSFSGVSVNRFETTSQKSRVATLLAVIETHAVLALLFQ